MGLEGFVKLFRKIAEWEYYTDLKTCHLFIHCLIMANHQDKEWRGISVKRGSFVTSYAKLSSETGLSIQNVRTCLKKLTKYLTHKATGKHSIITVKNYSSYQNINTTDNTKINKQLTTTKNEKNNKNIKESLSIENKIKDEERELLKKYLLRQKRKPDNLNAYISTLINNGDWAEIVRKEKLREENIPDSRKYYVPEERVVLTEEEDEKIREIQRKIRESFKNKGII